ncbi:nicotinate phosphoribosyltransferase [Paraburkholderia aspalathi]|nr:nicotinate phosphoribosyltransferase [Paraburkholderia aspalathi]MBK3779843.1 nicotinate phosphoribosyltransferase [Paraburkholderia aspalathi]
MNAPATLELNDTKNGLNPWGLADFYKTGHPAMYPKATTKLIANFTPRSAKYAPVLPQLFDNKVVWMGLEGFIKEYLIGVFNREFFGAKSKAMAVRKYKRRMDTALGKDAVSVAQLEAIYELGYLPLEIRALPEGARVNIKVPPVIFISTHDDFPWISTYFETLFSTENWKPSTVATIAFEFRKLLTYFAKVTGSPEEFVDWQGHDFSMRGMSGVHDAMRCGTGHLLSFTGTDTIPAIDYAEDFYGADADTEIVGGSIPATEHSVMTLRILLTMMHITNDPTNAGKSEKALRRIAEREVIRELVSKDFPAGMLSIVADSFDYWNTITVVAAELKDIILARKADELGRCKIVFRPDSGDPVKIITGYFDDELEFGADGTPLMVDGKYVLKDGFREVTDDLVTITEAERKGSVQCLWDIFGGTETDKGFKVLDSHVGLIYGDSISLPRARDIMLRLVRKGFASCNVVFGIGSYTYNMLSRDTFGWAMKAIYAEVGGEQVAIYKDPATDDGTKKSAKGLLRVEKEGNDYVLYEQQTLEQFEGGELVPVFRNGELLVETTLAEMRARLKASWVCPEPGSIAWSA